MKTKVSITQKSALNHKVIITVARLINLLNNNYLINNLVTIIDYVSIIIDYKDWVALCLLIILVVSAVLPFVALSLSHDNKSNNHKRWHHA